MRKTPALFKRHWKKIAALAAVVLIAVLGYFLWYLPSQTQTAETFTVKKGNLKEELTIPGEIDASEHAVLQFQTGGQLAWVGVKEGDIVNKYQGIASLDTRSVQKNLQKALEAYKQDRNAHEQSKDDYDDSTNDEFRRLMENAQASLNSAVLDVELQDLALKYANIWSPIDGLVVRVDSPHVGVNITPNEAEFEIINPSTIFFKATADQTEVSKIKEGDSVDLVLDAFPEDSFKGTVKKIAFVPTVNDSGTNYEIEITIAKGNFGNKYKIGMTGDATFITKKRPNALFVPIKFVKQDGSKKYLTVKSGDKFEKSFVTTGIETDNDVEILSGIKQGDVVVDQK